MQKSKIGGVTKDYIIIYKNNSFFYNIYNIDAYIMNVLFNYKVLDNNKCGFPESSLNKVLEKLENCKINYQIIYTYKDPVIKDFKKLNKYMIYKDKAINNMDMQKRIDLIINKITNSDAKKIEEILKVLEDVCD